SFDYISNARTFTVTVSDLTSEDAGKYWCGVTRTGQDIYTEVKLKLAPGKQKLATATLHFLGRKASLNSISTLNVTLGVEFIFEQFFVSISDD
uniref:Immunoglobulin V-set domain-containing protein n=1 Tax=Pundamilia nyererei TaxID=303518 RepID=A0A3B4FC72_9CICH